MRQISKQVLATLSGIAIGITPLSATAAEAKIQVLESLCAKPYADVAFTVEVGSPINIYLHQAEYAQIQQNNQALELTPIFTEQLVQVGLDRGCAEFLVKTGQLSVTSESEELSINYDLIGRVNFGFDEASLTAQAKRILASIRESVKGAETPLRVEGHTDDIGDASYNLILGLRRANGVKAFLVSNDADPRKLSAVSFGETMPIADNNTASGRADNRRVDIKRQ